MFGVHPKPGDFSVADDASSEDSGSYSYSYADSEDTTDDRSESHEEKFDAHGQPRYEYVCEKAVETVSSDKFSKDQLCEYMREPNCRAVAAQALYAFVAVGHNTLQSEQVPLQQYIADEQLKTVLTYNVNSTKARDAKRKEFEGDFSDDTVTRRVQDIEKKRLVRNKMFCEWPADKLLPYSFQSAVTHHVNDAPICVFVATDEQDEDSYLFAFGTKEEVGRMRSTPLLATLVRERIPLVSQPTEARLNSVVCLRALGGVLWNSVPFASCLGGGNKQALKDLLKCHDQFDAQKMAELLNNAFGCKASADEFELVRNSTSAMTPLSGKTFRVETVDDSATAATSHAAVEAKTATEQEEKNDKQHKKQKSAAASTASALPATSAHTSRSTFAPLVADAPHAASSLLDTDGEGVFGTQSSAAHSNERREPSNASISQTPSRKRSYSAVETQTSSVDDLDLQTSLHANDKQKTDHVSQAMLEVDRTHGDDGNHSPSEPTVSSSASDIDDRSCLVAASSRVTLRRYKRRSQADNDHLFSVADTKREDGRCAAVGQGCVLNRARGCRGFCSKDYKAFTRACHEKYDGK